MEGQRKAQKRRKSLPSPSPSSSACDRFGDLPAGVMEEILTRLPIRDAVRTSALSTRWRHRWHAMPTLSFDPGCLPPHLWNPTQDARQRWSHLARAVDHVLSLRFGPVRAFHLSFDQPGGPDVARWLLYMCRRLVESVTLSFSGGGACKLPSHLFLCQDLRSLSLCGCLLQIPDGFAGFKSLRVLALRNVRFAGDGLGGLISNSPALRALSLDRVHGCVRLSITAPELAVLRICGTPLTNLSFESTPRLVRVTIGLHCDCNLVKSPNALLNVRMLGLEQESLLVLAKLSASDGLASTYDQLTTLHLDIDFASDDETVVALSLLRGCPRLQKLSVQATTTQSDLSSFEDEEYSDLSSDEGTGKPASHLWEDHERVGFSLDQLVEANVAGIVGMAPELKFIKFILASSPALRAVTVSMQPSRRAFRESKVIKELLQFRRASAQAEVFYSDKVARNQKKASSQNYYF